jgi:tRNA (guanosine-2'-O-)-methyltransferase
MQRERTQQRQQKIAAVLQRRQPDLTVVLENVHDPHNVSAVLRTCDAVGVLEVHLLYTVEPFPELSHRTSASAYKWVELQRHRSVRECIERLRAERKRLWVAAPHPEARSLYELDLTIPVALIFGNEHRGVSPELLAAADGVYAIPQVGMVQSLNISVACAVSLYEAFRQRWSKGLYAQQRLSPERFQELYQAWLRR